MKEDLFLDRVIKNNPGISSLILGAAGIGSTCNLIKEEDSFFKYWLYALSVVCSLFFYVFVSSASRLKEPILEKSLMLLFDSPRIILKEFLFKRQKNYDGLIELLDEQRRYLRYENGINFQIGSLYIKKGELESSIEYFRRVFENPCDNDFNFGIFDKIAYKLLDSSRKKAVRREPFKLENYFDLIDIGIRKGNFQQSVEYWQRICDLDIKEKIELNVLFALFLDSLKNRFNWGRNSSEQWKRTIELILDSPDLEGKFKGISEDSRNQVLEIGPSEFLKNTFVFKRGENLKELKKGFYTNLILYSSGKNGDRPKLVRSLEFLEGINGLSYDISQRKPFRNLEDIFERANDNEKGVMLGGALANERRIHEISRELLTNNHCLMCGNGEKVKVELEYYNYRGTLERRLLERLGTTKEGIDFSTTIIKELLPLNGVMNLVHGDLAISNLLQDGTVLDFEKAGYGNPLIDVVTTLEDPKNGTVNRRNILSENYLIGVDGKEVELIEESYDVHTVFISACQIGSKISQSEKSRLKPRKSRKLMERAKGFMGQILEKGSPSVRDKFSKYIRSIDRGDTKYPDAVKELQACL